MRNPLRPRDDDRGVRSRRRLDDREVAALLSGRPVEGEPELTALTTVLRSLTEAPAPAPSDALAAMLADGVAQQDRLPLAPDEHRPFAPAVEPRKAPRRLGLGLVTSTAALALLLGGAVANALPEHAQNAVSTVVGWVSPVHLPRHTPAPHPTPRSEPVATARPTPSAPTTSPSPVAPPSAHPTRPAAHVTPAPQDTPSTDDGVVDEQPTDEQPTDEPTPDDSATDSPDDNEVDMGEGGPGTSG